MVRICGTGAFYVSLNVRLTKSKSQVDRSLAQSKHVSEHPAKFANSLHNFVTLTFDLEDSSHRPL